MSLAGLIAEERGAIRTADLSLLSGVVPHALDTAVRIGSWWIDRAALDDAARGVEETLSRFHAKNPLRQGADLALVRSAVEEAAESAGRAVDAGFVDAALEALEESGTIVRETTSVRLASHRVALEGSQEDVERLLAAIGEAEPSPPTLPGLVAAGFSRDLIEAAAARNLIVRVSADIVMTAGFVQRAEDLLRTEAADGITVSAFRERLGTSRKYALPLLEWFDNQGVTRRQGDLRVLRPP